MDVKGPTIIICFRQNSAIFNAFGVIVLRFKFYPTEPTRSTGFRQVQTRDVEAIDSFQFEGWDSY